jgi:broad specificity phosphatase PhoE
MQIIFVRHGQSVANTEGRWQGQLDYELSNEGKHQSELLRDRFAKEVFKPNFVYSSPLIRAMETAQIAMPGKRIIKIDDLKERGVGIFEGKNMLEIRNEHPEIAIEFERTRNFNSVPGAESRYNFRKRAEKVVDFLIKGHDKNAQITVFTHSGLLMFIVAVVMGTSRIWTLRIPNTSIFDFRIDPGSWDIRNSVMQTTAAVQQHFGVFDVRRFADADHLREN